MREPHAAGPGAAKRARWVLCIALSAGSLAAGGAFKSFKSKLYGYTARYPSDWHIWPRSDNLSIENYPPSKTATGVRLPAGGALIYVLSSEAIRRPTTPRTVRAWIDIDTRCAAPATTRTLDLERSDGKLSVTETTGECCDVAPPFQSYVTWYFWIRNRLFKATLLYWQGDPESEKLRGTLRDVVLSLRVEQR